MRTCRWPSPSFRFKAFVGILTLDLFACGGGTVKPATTTQAPNGASASGTTTQPNEEPAPSSPRAPSLPSLTVTALVGSYRLDKDSQGSYESWTFELDGSYSHETHEVMASEQDPTAEPLIFIERGTFSTQSEAHRLLTDEPASAIRAYATAYISSTAFVPEAALPTSPLTHGIEGSFASYKRLEAYEGALSDDETSVVYEFNADHTMTASVTSTAEGTVLYTGQYGPLEENAWAFTAQDLRRRELQAFVYLVDGMVLSVGLPPFLQKVATDE